MTATWLKDLKNNEKYLSCKEVRKSNKCRGNCATCTYCDNKRDSYGYPMLSYDSGYNDWCTRFER